MRPLISVSELREARRAAPRPVLLDVRWRLGGPSSRPDYLAGHLPDAIWVDLDTELAGPPGAGGRHPLPSREALQEAGRRWGLDADSAVVAYDWGDGFAAARAWWVLRDAGLRDVRVLDGGFAAWVAAGAELSAEAPRVPSAGTFEARPGQLPALDADAAARLAVDGVLLDARTAERFRGEQEPIDPIAGHIPGAVSAPAGPDQAPDGTFRSAAELRARYAALGLLPGTRAGAYCGSGVTAARTVLALASAGIEVALYPGSWSEWITDPARAVATGA